MAYKYVPVPKEDTYKLIERAQQGDEDAKSLIIEQNTGLVKKLALKFTSAENEADDLIQIGYIGLLKAVYKFEPGYDVMFSTYAVPMIIGEIKRYFRDNGRIKAGRALKSEIFAMKKLQDELSHKLGYQPKLSQVAEAMGISIEHVLELTEASSALSNIASLDNQLVEEEYDSVQSYASPEGNIEGIMLKSEIENLKAKERQVIILRYYKDMTQQEIAKTLGISQVQVSRIEKKAISNIRQKIAE